MKKNYTNIFLLGLVILSSFTLFSCREKPLVLGQERIIEESEKKPPKWVLQPKTKDRKYYYFVGTDDSVDNNDRFAYQDAVAQVGMFISTKTNSLFKNTQTEIDVKKVDRLKETIIENVSQSSIKGVEKRDRYWEKYEKLTEDGIIYFYRMHVLVRVPKKSIKTMEQQTLEMQRLNYKSENDDEMVNLLKKIEKSVLIEKSDN